MIIGLYKRYKDISISIDIIRIKEKLLKLALTFTSLVIIGIVLNYSLNILTKSSKG
jgi:hypothetical protein